MIRQTWRSKEEKAAIQLPHHLEKRDIHGQERDVKVYQPAYAYGAENHFWSRLEHGHLA